jgi:hypothetical protein
MRYKIRLEKIAKTIQWFIYLSTIINSLQIFLFLGFGRLPALAYKNSISVRFGSIWDDPNAYSLFLSFAIPFLFFSKIKPIFKWFLLLLNLLFLLISQSLTGIASFVVAIIIVKVIALLFPWKREVRWSLNGPFRYFAISISVLVAVAGLLLIFYGYDIDNIIKSFMLLKQGSIEGHKGSSDILRDVSFLTLLGLAPIGTFGESGYINRIVNFGLPWFIGSIILMFVSYIKIIIVFKKKYFQSGSEVLYALLFFIPSIAISLINLPFDNVFPINLLTITFLCLIWQDDRLI